jgi:hypothetical protein
VGGARPLAIDDFVEVVGLVDIGRQQNRLLVTPDRSSLLSCAGET